MCKDDNTNRNEDSGMDTNYASLAYGVYVGTDLDSDEIDRIENVLPTIKDECPNVRTVYGGDCTGQTIFLVTHVMNVESGGYRDTADITAGLEADWRGQLEQALRVLSYTGLKRPSWMCITELT